MKLRYRHLVYLAAVIILVCAAGPHAVMNIRAFAAEAVNEKAGDFSLTDLDGRNFKLSDYRGKPVLLIFSTTWCGYCRSEIPHFKDIHSKYSRLGLEVINIDIQEPRDRVLRFAQRYELPYRILLDETGRVAELYSIMGVPAFILIDGKGKILCWQCRRVDAILETMFGKR